MPIDRLNHRKAVQHALRHHHEIGSGHRRRSLERALELLEDDLLFFEPDAQLVQHLLRHQAEFQHLLVVLPRAAADEDRHEQAKEQQHRQRHRAQAGTPQCSGLAEEDEHQREHDQDAKRVADPPGHPTRRQIPRGYHAERPQAADRQGGAGQAAQRRQQQKARQLSAIVEGRGVADRAFECPAGQRGLGGRGRRDQRGGNERRRQLPGARAIADPEVEDQRPEENPRQAGRAGRQHRRRGNPGRWKDRRRITRRHRQ